MYFYLLLFELLQFIVYFLMKLFLLQLLLKSPWYLWVSSSSFSLGAEGCILQKVEHCWSACQSSTLPIMSFVLGTPFLPLSLSSPLLLWRGFGKIPLKILFRILNLWPGQNQALPHSFTGHSPLLKDGIFSNTMYLWHFKFFSLFHISKRSAKSSADAIWLASLTPMDKLLI